MIFPGRRGSHAWQRFKIFLRRGIQVGTLAKDWLKAQSDAVLLLVEGPNSPAARTVTIELNLCRLFDWKRQPSSESAVEV